MTQETPSIKHFSELGLTAPVLKAVLGIGYETPTPIQAQTIPLVMSGRDVLGQAQTGTGKTAAFALPLLSRINMRKKKPQVLVLAPTRELAIQVAEAFQKYAAHLKGFYVLPIYGGQDYSGQLRQLKRGVQVVVGTPGRVMDHMRRKTLDVSELDCMVLDEADEMLRMGFIDDVEWVLEQTPDDRQIALFSATMPDTVRRIANKHLNDPAHITIKAVVSTAETIRQRYWPVSGLHKLDALTRILETEETDGIIIFVRTKIATAELAEKLAARGYATAALNSDISQKQRELTIKKLKESKLDILVATDVAARGLDVQRISHVVNYDIPYDTESYVHRIGRTGRAGRKGEAILFVSPRETRLLRAIEKATRQKIEQMKLPSTEDVNNVRIGRFKQRISDALSSEDLNLYQQIIEQYQQEHNVPALEVAAALAKLAQGRTPLLVKNVKPKRERANREEKRETKNRSDKRRSRDGEETAPRKQRSERKPRTVKLEKGMERFRIEVGHDHDVKPGNIVGAIANEAGLDSTYIGHISINDNYSTVDLPVGMPREVLRDLKKTWVAGQQLNMSREGEARTEPSTKAKPRKKPAGKAKSKPVRKKAKKA